MKKTDSVLSGRHGNVPSKQQYIEPHFLPLGQIVGHNAERFPKVVALTKDERETTWVDFDRYINQVANGLLAAGLNSGARIAYIGKTSDYAFQIMHGVAKARCIFTPVNWRLAPPEVAYILNDACAEFIFVAKEFLSLVEQSTRNNRALKGVVVMESGPGDDQIDFPTWRNDCSSEPVDTEIDSADVVLQLYTSGTTGNPKGALITHDYVMNSAKSYHQLDEDVTDMFAGEEYLNFLPIFHTSGAISGQYPAMTRGCGIVILEDFIPQKIFECISERAIPVIGGVPTMLQAFLSDPQFLQADFSGVRYVMYGAAPIPIPLRDQLERLIGCRFVQGYGATETLSISLLSPEDHLCDSERLKSVGREMPGVEIKIIAPNGDKLGVSEIGEIAVRSPVMAKGYWQLPEASDDAFKDGWYRTGDGGYLDEGGYLFLKERIKDLIISGGENIYPIEIENVLYEHPSVAAAAVVAAPHEKWGEVPFAFIVVKDGKEFDSSELKNFVSTKLAKFKQPKQYAQILELPLTGSGKVLKKDLREIVLDQFRQPLLRS